MKILDVYRSYKIPKNLQSHMLTVAALGQYISENFNKSIDLNINNIVEALLLHDMGNVIKFDIDVTRSLGVSEDELAKIEKVKAEFIKRYGNDEHSATYAIARELKVSDRVIEIIADMGSSKAEELVTTDKWEAKITTYADNRVKPGGITTLEERWADIAKRYKGSSHKLGSEEVVERRKKFSFELESQIQSKCSIDLQMITDSTIVKYVNIVMAVEI